MNAINHFFRLPTAALRILDALFVANCNYYMSINFRIAVKTELYQLHKKSHSISAMLHALNQSMKCRKFSDDRIYAIVIR